MNLKDRMKQDEKPTVQDPQNSISTIEKSKLLEEQSNQIRALMTQNGNLKDTLQQSEAERQRITSENSGLRKELQRKSAEIVRLNEKIVKLSESDKTLSVAEQKLNDLQRREKDLQRREKSLQILAGNVDKREKDLNEIQNSLDQKKENLDEEIDKAASKKAVALAEQRVKDAKKAQEKAENGEASSDHLCRVAGLITAVALSAVVVRSGPLLKDFSEFFGVIGMILASLFSLCPMAYRGVVGSISGAGGVFLGVVAFIVVLVIILVSICLVVAFSGFNLTKNYGKFLFLGVALVYIQGVIKDQYPDLNLIVLWILAYIGFQVVAYFVQDYINAKNDSYY